MKKAIYILIAWACSCHSLKFASYYQDRMVLQREPVSATIWGKGDILPEAEVALYCQESGWKMPPQKTKISSLIGKEGEWKATLPPQLGGAVCDIQILNGFESIGLKQVMFGDVWFCSGQSNMARGMDSIENATEEIASSARYTDIRYSIVQRKSEPEEQDDALLVIPWSSPDDSVSLAKMSATCFLFARYIYDQINIPIGLVDSSVDETSIEAWSTLRALQECEIPNHIDDVNPYNSNSFLWNSMVAPFRRMTIKGFLWYQGESNMGYNTEKYNCTFPTLIDTWREQFSNNSNTLAKSPFGFVQLSTVKYGTQSLAFPHLRHHQTADYDFVPNQRMESVFMAVSVDTYDEENGIHPRYKQIIGERLGISGMRVAYGNEYFPVFGPTLREFFMNIDDTLLIVSFDSPISYNNAELSGFYTCCGDDQECMDANIGSDWPAIDPMMVEHATATDLTIQMTGLVCQDGSYPSLAYLWRQTPIQTPTWGAPIYSNQGFILPAAPWIVKSIYIPFPK